MKIILILAVSFQIFFISFLLFSEERDNYPALVNSINGTGLFSSPDIAFEPIIMIPSNTVIFIDRVQNPQAMEINSIAGYMYSAEYSGKKGFVFSKDIDLNYQNLKTFFVIGKFSGITAESDDGTQLILMTDSGLETFDFIEGNGGIQPNELENIEKFKNAILEVEWENFICYFEPAGQICHFKRIINT